jgi:hypothetical protein
MPSTTEAPRRMGRPLKQGEHAIVQTFSAPESFIASLRAKSTETGVPMSRMIRDALAPVLNP